MTTHTTERDIASEVQDAATGTRDRLGELAEPLAAAPDRIQEEIERADMALRRACREHPLATLATATLAGFIIGRALSRR